ncbi:MAG: hypothetical protein CVV52_19190 [Spirochaetae bacterium HGW-Spirochaetae-8]|nr:MAG: hypothetical protein CVV52_19190 [Spirochaetae bacterium HGW-Spirochaetae-8]
MHRVALPHVVDARRAVGPAVLLRRLEPLPLAAEHLVDGAHADGVAGTEHSVVPALLDQVLYGDVRILMVAPQELTLGLGRDGPAPPLVAAARRRQRVDRALAHVGGVPRPHRRGAQRGLRRVRDPVLLRADLVHHGAPDAPRDVRVE